MSNGMRESQDGAAFLEHLDGETFGRFAEYIHSGDYSAASPVEMATASGERDILQVMQVEAYEEVDGIYDDFGQFVGSASKKKKRGKKVAPTPWSYEDEPETFRNESGSASPGYPTPFPIHPIPGPNRSVSMSYTMTMIGHVSVYQFAQEYLIPGLKELARQKFSDTLNIFRCYPERTEDVCQVIRQVYNHEDGGPDPSSLHNIVSEYAARNFRVLTKSSHFRNLLAEGGAFPPDLCSKVASILL